jgi:hypothetical protein
MVNFRPQEVALFRTDPGSPPNIVESVWKCFETHYASIAADHTAELLSLVQIGQSSSQMFDPTRAGCCSNLFTLRHQILPSCHENAAKVACADGITTVEISR